MTSEEYAQQIEGIFEDLNKLEITEEIPATSE